MSRYHQIAEEIEGMIQADKFPEKLPTIDELAHDFAVSKVTMQRAIKVLKDKKTIGTAPGRGIWPTRLKRARTHILGAVLATSGGSPLHEQLISGLNYEAIKHGEIVAVTGGTQDDPTTELETIRRVVEKQGVDGVILWPTNGNKSKSMGVKYLQDHKVPFVLVPETDPEVYAECNTVSNFDSEGGSEVMMHLIGAGYKNIVFLSQKSCKKAIFNKNRYQQYQRSMELAGLEPQEIRYVEKLTPPQLKKMDACFCVNDDTAFDVLQMALEHGIKIPGDVAVVGYDNTPTAYNMGLSSVEQHFEKIGEMAIDLLLKDIEGKSDPQHLNVKSELIIRCSTTPKKA